MPFLRGPVDEERGTDAGDDDDHGGGEDVVPVDGERDLVTPVQAVRLAVPVENTRYTSPVITSPLRAVLTLPAAGWV